MWASCRFRKKKSTMEEKIQKIKEELEAKYEKELAERKEECEQLKEKVKRLKRHIRKMRKAYEGQTEPQMNEEKNQETSDLNEFRSVNDEFWNASMLETLNNASELQSEMTYEFCGLSPISTDTNSIEKLDQRTNFCREAAVGILYNIPMLRDAVLNHTEADQRQGELQILYDVFSQMGRPPHLPNSEILQKLPVKDSLLEYIGVFLNHILYKVPHLPTNAFENVNQWYKKEALDTLESARNSLVECIMFSAYWPAVCNCEKETNNKLQYFVLNYGEAPTLHYYRQMLVKFDDNATCSKCNANYKNSEEKNGEDPDFGHFYCEKWNATFVENVYNYSFTAGVLQKKATGEYSYVTKKKNVYWHITRNGVKVLDNIQKVVDLFKDPSLSLGIVQYENSRPLDHDVLNAIRNLEDPPARFKNIWGECSPITVSNVLLCLPKKLRRRLKELEVPKGERPNTKCIALLWEIIDGSEKVVAKQKIDNWVTPSPYPERIYSLLMKLGIQHVLCANIDGRGRMVGAGGSTIKNVLNALFERHSQSDAFNAFGSYKVIKNGEKLEKCHLNAKELNIVAFEDRIKKPPENSHFLDREELFNAIFEGRWTLGEVLLVRPKNSLLLVVVVGYQHGYLMIIRPQGDVITVDNDCVSFDGKIPDSMKEISDSMKARKVTAFICIPDQSET